MEAPQGHDPSYRVTLWADAIQSDVIPPYPTFSIKRAKGGEETWQIIEQLPVGDGSFKILTDTRPAVVGEPLRDAELMLLPDTTKNMEHRLTVAARCANNPVYREAILRVCKSDILFWINTFVSIQNPRWNEPVIPFVTFPYQDRFISWMMSGLRAHRTQVVLKSREMGFTWLAAAVVAWLSMFYPNWISYMMSLTEKVIDNRTINSLFGKVRWIIGAQPEWMRQGWVNRGEGIDKLMEINFPNNFSLIEGVLSKSTAGRSGRASFLMWDEAAHAERDSAVQKALSSLSAYNLIGSTPNGQDGEFYRMCDDPRTDKFIMHYTDHPLKDALWKLRERNDSRYTEAIWAQEQELSFEGSTEGRVFPQFQPDKIIMDDGQESPWYHVRDDEYSRYDAAYPVDTGQDYGHADPCSVVWGQVKPVPPHLKVYGAPYLLSVYSEFEMRGMTAFDLRYVLNNKENIRYRYHVGDARTGNQTGADGETWRSHMRDNTISDTPKFSKVYGSIIPGPPVAVEFLRKYEDEEIETLRRVFQTPGHFALYGPGTNYLRKAITSWGYPTDEEGRPMAGSSPNHDHWSHIIKALIYLVMWIDSEFKNTPKDTGHAWNYPGMRIRTR
jgi:hypothetical protein